MVALSMDSAFSGRVAAAFAATQDVLISRDCMKRPRWFDETGDVHYYEDEVCERMASFLGGQRWPQLVGSSFSKWRERTEAPLLLSPVGLFLLLPAFLLNTDNKVQSDYGFDVTEAAFTLGPLVNRLTRPSTPGSSYYRALLKPNSTTQTEAMMGQCELEFDDFASRLNRYQRDVICEFLSIHKEFFSEDEFNMAELAMESY